MAHKNESKKDKNIPAEPAKDSLEKEIEDLISREKTRRNIVSKLLNQPNSKIKKSNK